MHPVFDCLMAARQRIGGHRFRQLEALRASMFESMLGIAMKMLARKPIDGVYFISHASLNRWFSRCGIVSEKVHGAAVRDTPAIHRLRSRHPRYWENEPMVFQLHRMRGEHEPALRGCGRDRES